MKKDIICTSEEKLNYQKRLNKIVGQINGISKMIENERNCDEVLIQVLAVNNAVKGFGQEMIRNHMKTCMVSDIQNGKYESIDEVMDLCKRLM